MRHHMAPMTGGISDAQKHGFILRFGFLERFAAPRMPVNGIVCVLKKIRRGFILQPVHFISPVVIIFAVLGAAARRVFVLLFLLFRFSAVLLIKIGSFFVPLACAVPAAKKI